DAGKIHAEVARQPEQTRHVLEILLGVHPRLALGAARSHQPLLLVEAQGLRVHLQHLGHDADHVERFGAIGHEAPPRYFAKSSRVGPGTSRSSSRTSSSVRASSPRGTSTRTVT